MSSCLDESNFVAADALKTIVQESENIQNKYILFTNWIITSLTKQDLSSIFIALAVLIMLWILINWFVRLIISIVWPIAFIIIMVVCSIY